MNFRYPRFNVVADPFSADPIVVKVLFNSGPFCGTATAHEARATSNYTYNKLSQPSPQWSFPHLIPKPLDSSAEILKSYHANCFLKPLIAISKVNSSSLANRWNQEHILEDFTLQAEPGDKNQATFIQTRLNEPRNGVVINASRARRNDRDQPTVVSPKASAITISAVLNLNSRRVKLHDFLHEVGTQRLNSTPRFEPAIGPAAVPDELVGAAKASKSGAICRRGRCSRVSLKQIDRNLAVLSKYAAKAVQDFLVRSVPCESPDDLLCLLKDCGIDYRFESTGRDDPLSTRFWLGECVQPWRVATVHMASYVFGVGKDRPNRPGGPRRGVYVLDAPASQFLCNFHECHAW